MVEISVDIIGYAAGIVLLICMIPQIVKSYRTKRVEDVSFMMVFMFILGSFLWSTYGFLINNMPLFWMDLLGFFMALIQMVLMIKYRGK